MAHRMAEAQSSDRAPGRRVVHRRLFAEEIGHDRHAVGARGQGGRQAIQMLVQRKARRIGRLSSPPPKSLGEPVKAGTAGRHAAIDHEKTRNQMIVEEQTRIGLDPACGDQYVQRAAELESTWPSRTTPAASADAIMSAAPPTTGVPAASPAAFAAASWTRPMISCNGPSAGPPRPAHGRRR